MRKKYSLLFVILLALNITLLLTSNIITPKLIIIYGFIFTAGDLLFPFTYILNDVFVEVYGYQTAKKTIIISFLLNLMMVIIIFIAIRMPYPDFWNNQEAFSITLGITARILFASFSAYILGSFINAKIMHIMKMKNHKKLYRRTIISTIFGEFIDTLIFVTIAFWGILSNIELLRLILNIYLIKVFIEILFTPLTYVIIKTINNKERI